MFRTVSRFRTGYDPDQVDTFFTHARRVYEGDQSEPLTGTEVRKVAFDLVRGGYATTSVDSALDRLERARTLYERLRRPDGERFAPARRGEQGYRPEDVDDMCHRLIDYFDKGTPLTSDEVRHVTFRKASGHNAYAEGPVDAFLERAVEVLLGVE